MGYGSANITRPSGHTLPWTNEIRYLGMNDTLDAPHPQSTRYAKRSFHKSINAILAELGE